MSVQREDLLEEVARAATNVIAKLPDEWFARGDKEVAELVIALDRLELNAHVTHLFDRARMEQE